MTMKLKICVLGSCCLPWLLAIPGCASTPPPAVVAPVAAIEATAVPIAPAVVSAAAPQMLDSIGVEVVGISLSASDFLIDLRYRVKDTARAQAMLDRKVRPVLVNETTGERYYVPNAPKVGQLRQTSTSKQVVQLDRVYFMLFANPDRKLKVGEKVTLYAGESVVHDLVVKR